MATQTLTKKDVRARIQGLPEDTTKAMICALVGHSRIQTTCFGYYYCGRCDAQVGDTLASTYDARGVVIVGHDCEVCRKHAKTLTWRDTWKARDPFPKKGDQ